MELLPLVCLCLLSCSGDAVRVVVEEDSDAVLPCLISTKEDITGKLLVWKKYGQKQVFMYDAGVHYNNGLRGQDEQFKGRVSFFQDQLQNGNASIKITRTKMADSGNYSCDFPRHQPRQTSIIELVVDPVLKDRTGENIPAVRVVVEEDSDAVLPCLISPEEDISGKLFDWRKDGQKEKKEVFMYDAGNHYNNGRPGQDEQFKDRVSFFQDQLQNGNASIKITRTKMADSGNYSCDFPRHQPSQTSIIELVVGAAPKPVINIHDVTKDGVLLHCKARGVSPLTVELKDGAGNILNSESTPKSERGSHSYIALNIAVTKTDNYSCVATQEQFSHQVTAMIPVYIQAVRVVVQEGSDAVLPCWIRTKEDLAGKFFDWRKDGQKEVFMYDAGVHSNNGRPGQDDQFKGRVSFFQDQLQNGSASIKITRTKMADSGTYSCDFPRHQPRQTSIIELVVAGVRVVVKEDSDAVLPCLISPKEDLTGKTFDWKKDGQDVFLHDSAGEREGPQFTDRVSHFEDQLQNGNASIKIRKTKKTDSGNYSCIFPHHQPSQTSIIKLVVGAAPKPSITTPDVTNDWVVLQCEAHGDPLPTIEWKDSDNKTLPADTPQISDRGGRSYITVNTTVTKTGRYRCVATQEKFSHQIAADTYVRLTVPPPEPGSSAGLFIGGVVCGLLVAAVAVVFYFKDRIRQICALGSRRNTANGPTGAELSANPMIDHSERL